VFYPCTKSQWWEDLAPSVQLLPLQPVKSMENRASTIRSRFSSLHWACLAFLEAKKALRQRHFDAVMSRSMPQYGHLPALWLKCLAPGLRWIACWSDPLPPAKSPPPYGRGNRGTAPHLALAYCRQVAKWADQHVFPSERLRRYVTEYLPEIQKKSSIIPHVMGPAPFTPSTPDNDLFTIALAGGLGLRRPHLFLEAVHRLVTQTDLGGKLRILVYGLPDPALPDLMARFKLEPWLKLMGPCDYDELQPLLAAANILVLIEADCPEGIFLPSKLVDYAQAGRPILAISPRVGTVRDFLDACGGGIVADVRSVEDIARGIKLLYQSWQNNDLESNYSSSRLQGAFSQKVVVQTYQELLNVKLGDDDH